MSEASHKVHSSTPTSLRGSLDMKSYVVEKEMLESQMRKLSLENSTLEMENKLLKDKYNRSVARVSDLESKLQETQDELHEAQSALSSESNRVSLTAKAEMERQIEQHQWKANSALKEVEILKSEIKFMEQQLASVKKELEIANQNADKSKIHEAHEEETQVLKTEISHLKHLLEESEKAVEAESARCRQMSDQIHKLSEIREVLQLQIEEGSSGGSTAEKRITSLEMRLHLTEERLTQERSDRAGNLSQIEEKLLTENAKLQTKAKELERQVKREKEKTRSLEQRVQEFREEALQLRLAIPDEDEQGYDIPNKRQSDRDSKKPAYDIKQILKQLEAESGLSRDENNQEGLLLYLWEKQKGLQQQQKEWKLYLDQLDLPEGEEGTSGLQSALAIKQEYETKMQKNEERMEDISAERITAEQTYKQQLTDLVKERHEAFARLQTLDDLMDALRAENESLRHSLATTSGSLEAKPVTVTAEVETLREEIAGLEAKVSQLNRKNKVLENDLSTLRGQLSSRDKELKEVYAQLQKRKSAPSVDNGEDRVRAERLHTLTIEVASLKEELRLQSDKSALLHNEKYKLDSELEGMRQQLKQAKKKSREQDLGSSLTQRQAVEELEQEIEKRDNQILQLTSQRNESEGALHQARAELAIQHKTQEELEAQIESIQRQLDERCQVLDALSGRESEQMEQLDMVKDMLQTLNQGLSQKQGEMEMLQLELQQAKDKISWLEDQKSQLTAQLSDSNLGSSGEFYRKSTPAATDIRVGELEAERDEMRLKVLQSTGASVSLQQEVETLNAEVVKAAQEASAAVANSTQVVNEKAVLERRVQTLEEEKRIKTQERDVCMQDLGKLESTLHEVISSFEAEGRRKFDDFTTEYKDDSPQGQKLIGEVHTLRLLTSAKDKENSVIMDKMRRQEQEKKNQEKICELLQTENDNCRKDVTRITHELVLKMKENSAAMEVNRVLVRDQSSMQKKMAALGTQLTQERERTERRKAEVGEVIKKIEHSEQTHQSTSLSLQQKDSVIGDLEVKLRHLNQNIATVESERDTLKAKVDQLNEDIRSLSNVNTGLAKKLETKENDLKEEKTTSSKHKEDAVATSHKLEVLKHEQNLLLGNLSTERKVQEKLKEEIKSHEEGEKKLREKIAELTGELETHRGQLVAARESIQQIKAEKEIFMKDYQDACRRLGEKENVLKEVQKKSEEEIIVAKQEMLQHSQAISEEKATKERDMAQLKNELENLKLELQRKENKQVEYDHSLKQLYDLERQNKDLEKFISEQDKIVSESKILVESLRKELVTLRDEKSELQDTIARKEVVILDLKDQLRSSGESTESQVVEMRHTIEGMRSHHEYEKKTLREALNKVEENLKQSVQEVRSLMETKEQLTEQVRTQERALTEANYKLSQEVASRKVLEEKLDHMKEVVEDTKKKKNVSEEKASSLQISMNKAESDQTIMRDRIKHLSAQLKDVETALSVSEGAVRTGEDKIESLKAELVRHQQMLENLKQQSNNKIRKLQLDLKQLSEAHEKEQLKLTQQCHQLSVDLEQARETMAVKSRENLKLQEQTLELQEQVREGTSKLKQTQDSLKHEEEMQTRLSSRFEEQESELKKLRNFLAKKADEDGDGKSIWQEMNRVISELSRQLQFHMETSQYLEQGGRDNSDLVYKLRRSLLHAESQLNTERALHQVTKSSMQALEEDCTRLRQMLYAVKRRGLKSDKKQKSRMEEINEIIARSQTRAQAMLASGEFSLDGSLRNLNPSRDYNTGEGNVSPDTSIASDASFSSAHFANMSFLNLSGGYPPFSPRK